jgi:hypothetical protein
MEHSFVVHGNVIPVKELWLSSNPWVFLDLTGSYIYCIVL